ncbi:condensation domain-containing protein [Streptomyces sp. NPDC018833]|uniref:condensation domain-containing protein n=1 Tax=Streptomyces sp. NPDC018833 TaxID=3365053 RepID=UPI00378F7196
MTAPARPDTPTNPAPAPNTPAVEEIHTRLAGWLAEAVLTPAADASAPLRDLGVDSLDLIRTARRIEAAFGVRVQLRELFAPGLTTARLAELVAERAARRGSADAAPPGAAHGPVVLTPSQEQAWEEQTGDRGHWNQAMLFTTRPDLDAELFGEAVRRLVAGHASLRLAVEARPARRPRQLVAAMAPDGLTGTAVDGPTGAASDGPTGTALDGSTGAGFVGSTGTAVDGPTGAVFGGPTGSTGAASDGPTGTALDGSTGAGFVGTTGAVFGGSTSAVVDGPTGTALDGPTGAVVDGPTGAAFGGSTGAASDGPTGTAPDGPTGTTLDTVLDTVDISELADAELSAAVTLRCAVEQRSLDPQAGRVARFVRFDAGPSRPGRLLIVVHQLAFDMVSWSVLLADLQELYTALEAGRRDVWAAEGTSYPQWAQALAAHARTPEAEAEAEWWTEVARTPATVPLDHAVADPRAANTAATAATHREEFPADLTARLHTAARAHRAHPGDLVLHALGEALADWLDEPAVRVDILRHGREETVGGTHLARTTGWFTTTVPVRLDLAPGTPAERLARTVGHLAALPGGGVGHGALARHGRPRISAALRAAPPSDVSFDFEGDDADALPLGTLLPDVAPEAVGDITAPHWVRPHLIEVIATTDDETLRVEWWYSALLHDQATVRGLAARHRAALTALVAAAAESAAPEARTR